MSAAADRRPFHERADKIFWRGTDISLQRQIMGKDKPVQDSPLADVHLIAKDDKGNLKDFTSLAQHCRYKYGICLVSAFLTLDHDWQRKLNLHELWGFKDTAQPTSSLKMQTRCCRAHHECSESVQASSVIESPLAMLRSFCPISFSVKLDQCL